MKKIQIKDFEINIDSDGEGYFEHDKFGEELGGSLQFENCELVDFDGVLNLPKEVIEGIIKLGYTIKEDQFCIEEKCSSIQKVLDTADLGNWSAAAELYKELQYTVTLQELNDQLILLNNEQLIDICKIGFIALRD